MYRIMGGAGSKCVVSAMQGDGTVTYVQHINMCIQEVTSQYNGISDWKYETLLCENYIINL